MSEHIYMTTNELAEMLRTTSGTIYGWTQRNYGPRPCKVGRKHLYRRTDVLAWLDSLTSRGDMSETENAQAMLQVCEAITEYMKEATL